MASGRKSGECGRGGWADLMSEDSGDAGDRDTDARTQAQARHVLLHDCGATRLESLQQRKEEEDWLEARAVGTMALGERMEATAGRQWSHELPI